MARWRERLGIKFNLEIILLPREMFKNRGATFTVHVGKPVGYDTLDTHHAPAEATRLRSLTYALRPDKPVE